MKIKCFLGFHETTSYAEAANYQGLLEINTKITRETGLKDKVKLFFEVSALRCRHCDYQYPLSETKNIKELLNPTNQPTTE